MGRVNVNTSIPLDSVVARETRSHYPTLRQVEAVEAPSVTHIHDARVSGGAS